MELRLFGSEKGYDDGHGQLTLGGIELLGLEVELVQCWLGAYEPGLRFRCPACEEVTGTLNLFPRSGAISCPECGLKPEHA
ncbi:MAG: hypothetical protein ABIJ46_01790 [bacterium]